MFFDKQFELPKKKFYIYEGNIDDSMQKELASCPDEKYVFKRSDRSLWLRLNYKIKSGHEADTHQIGLLEIFADYRRLELMTLTYNLEIKFKSNI